MTVTARPTRMTADERRDAIVAAGIEEFATGGLVGASTDAIARRAGVSQPYVFQLFGTKKELFLAVVRRCFERTRLAFEQAARDFVPGADPACDSVLGAMALSYYAQLADRNALLVQLQAYAACADPDVQAVVREEFGRLHRRVRALSGADLQDIHRFFAEGMLLNIAAAVEFAGDPKSWMLAQMEGGT
ncbi:MAG TPA: TetR/AcrR family transcriptional regulator [Verrucomicrobiae bacterium]|jgi:AcrR family transcriptional regulator|nr:TetR/AcrR family transcriptional regulator [Verrucomicrobiae bacterium]